MTVKWSTSANPKFLSDSGWVRWACSQNIKKSRLRFFPLSIRLISPFSLRPLPNASCCSSLQLRINRHRRSLLSRLPPANLPPSGPLTFPAAPPRLRGPLAEIRRHRRHPEAARMGQALRHRLLLRRHASGQRSHQGPIFCCPRTVGFCIFLG